MKVFITGGAGFLGSNLTERLLGQGHEVLVLDNYATASRDSLAPHDNLEVVEGSIIDQELMTALFDKFQPEVVVHAAAAYKDPDDWNTDAMTNVEGTINTVKLSLKHNVKRLVYLQTALCYGVPQQRPIPVDHPLAPMTSYSISKTAGEQYLAMSGLPFVSLRLANVYGPRTYCGPMPAFYKRIKAGLKCSVVDTRRDFLYIDDVYSLFDAILAGKGADGCYNVSSGKDCTIKDIYDLTVEHMGVTPDEPVEVVPPGEDDLSTLLLDPSKAEKEFGWKACTPLSEGMAKLIDWYDQNGVEAVYTHLKKRD